MGCIPCLQSNIDKHRDKANLQLNAVQCVLLLETFMSLEELYFNRKPQPWNMWRKVVPVFQYYDINGMKYHLIKVFIRDWAPGDKSLVMAADYFHVSSFTFIHLAHQLFLSDKFSSQFVRKSLNKDTTDCLCLFVPVMLESDSRHWVLSVPGHLDDSPDHPRIVPLWPSSNWAQPYITLQLN